MKAIMQRLARTLVASILFITLVGAVTVYAAEMGGGTDLMKAGLKAVGAGLSMLGGAVGAGYAIGAVGAASLAVVSEKPEEFGRTLLYIGIAETPAIYGIAIAMVIIFAT